MKAMLVLVALMLVAGQVQGVVVLPGQEISAEDGAVLRVPVEQTDVVYALLYLGDGVAPGEMWGVRDGAGSLVDTGLITAEGQRLKLDITGSVRSATEDTLTFTLEKLDFGDSGDKAMARGKAVRVGMTTLSSDILAGSSSPRPQRPAAGSMQVADRQGDAGVKVFPNPFNPVVQFRLVLPRSERVELVVYDLRGRVVRKLADGMYSMGSHTWSWDGRDGNGEPVASGVYFYRSVVGSRTQVGKLALLK